MAVFDKEHKAKGWDGVSASALDVDTPLLGPVSGGTPFSVPDVEEDGPELPQGLARPVLGVPAASPVRCFAVSLYGPHASGPT
jgi:hypothetical protein